ncbi:hypothetical protein B0H13DRAFT_1861545 [Mycena leptocephala]|nr:hypothetical protein B0H13DRAFT_1861545 [Mycena leptocephala]
MLRKQILGACRVVPTLVTSLLRLGMGKFSNCSQPAQIEPASIHHFQSNSSNPKTRCSLFLHGSDSANGAQSGSGNVPAVADSPPVHLWGSDHLPPFRSDTTVDALLKNQLKLSCAHERSRTVAARDRYMKLISDWRWGAVDSTTNRICSGGRAVPKKLAQVTTFRSHFLNKSKSTPARQNKYYMLAWLLPGIIQCLSDIDPDIWDVMEATTNFGEVQHAAKAETGIGMLFHNGSLHLSNEIDEEQSDTQLLKVCLHFDLAAAEKLSAQREPSLNLDLEWVAGRAQNKPDATERIVIVTPDLVFPAHSIDAQVVEVKKLKEASVISLLRLTGVKSTEGPNISELTVERVVGSALSGILYNAKKVRVMRCTAAAIWATAVGVLCFVRVPSACDSVSSLSPPPPDFTLAGDDDRFNTSGLPRCVESSNVRLEVASFPFLGTTFLERWRMVVALFHVQK